MTISVDWISLIVYLYNVGHKTVRGIAANLVQGESFEIYMTNLKNKFDRLKSPTVFYGNIAKFKVSYLDASSRLLVAKKTSSYNPHDGYPQNLLQSLFGNAEIESSLQEAFNDTFTNEIKLDYSGMIELAFRVSKDFGEIPKNPREAFPVMENSKILDDQGDGYKSFVGVVLSLLLSKDRVILLDEPEAFLHPAQARQLGLWISKHSKNIPGQIIISTHNSNFLLGILAGSQDVDIYRLNRVVDTTQYKLMSASDMENLVKNPLLSSQRILDSIFHRGVVVCEADADRAIYQTVASKELNTQEYLFIHAHNKQSIAQVTTLLHNICIPVCAIADIDIINDPCLIIVLESMDGDVDMSTIKESQKDIISTVENIEEIQAVYILKDKIEEFYNQLLDNKHTLAGARGALNRLRKEASNWATMKAEGVLGAPKEVRKKLDLLISISKKNHLYIVPVGELEKWIDLGVSQKNKWIVPALEEVYNGKSPEILKQFVSDIIKDLENVKV